MIQISSALWRERDGPVRHEIARLETKVERARADLITWSFVFWVRAVGAIALLAAAVKQGG